MKEEGMHGQLEILPSTVDICRDFLRNVCYRDKRCKYKHLTSEELLASVNTKLDPGSSNITYEFCHDFQNQGCDRPNCKFIHCSADTEQEFNEKGILPLRLKYEFELGVQELFVAPLNADSIGDNIQEKSKPVCRDYIQRQCRRGKKCRFAHVEQPSNLQKDDFGSVSSRMRLKHDQSNHACNESGEKRLRLLPEECNQDYSLHPDAIHHMKEENMMLRKEVASLRKQVSGLSATNEVLLEQNAQFRLQKRYTVESGTPFSQGATQSSMSVSVPIAMSLSLPRQTQQLTNNPGLAGAALITSDSMPPVDPTPQTVSVRTHATVPAQAHIQFPQNTAAIVNSSQLVDDLQSLSNHQASVAPSQGLHASVPVLQQANLTGSTFSNYQNAIPITQNMVRSIPALTTSSSSGAMLQNASMVNGALTGQSTLSLNCSQSAQNIAAAAANGLVVQSGQNITVEANAKSLGHLNHNMATAQMTRATLVSNHQDPASARPTAGDLSASIAAVAAQVIAAHAQPNSEMGTAQISVPTVPCVTLAPAIVPVTITTSLPVARMVPSHPLDNSSTGLIATQMNGSGQTPARVSMVNTCLASANTLSLNASHQVISTVNGHRVVNSQQQLNAPINFTINPVPTNVPQPPGPGMHS